MIEGRWVSCEREQILETSGLIHRYGQVPTIENINDYMTYEHSAYFAYLCERNREQPIFQANRYAAMNKEIFNEERAAGGLIPVLLTLPEILDGSCGGIYVPYAKAYIAHAAILNGLRYFPQAVRDFQSRDYFDRKAKSKDTNRQRVYLFFTRREMQIIDRWGLRGYSPKRTNTLRTLLLLGLGDKHTACAIYGIKVAPRLLGPINTERLCQQTEKAIEPYFKDVAWCSRFYNNNGRDFQVGYDKPYLKELIGTDMGNFIAERCRE